VANELHSRGAEVFFRDYDAWNLDIDDSLEVGDLLLQEVMIRIEA
jgi:hypothetical protein